jgi:hypothetical protein
VPGNFLPDRARIAGIFGEKLLVESGKLMPDGEIAGIHGF